MKTIATHSSSRSAFTLVELLVVIGIIGIVASLLLPVLGEGRNDAKKARAKIEMGQIITAAQAYKAAYGHWPASTSALANGSPDFTFGNGTVQNGAGHESDNREVIGILTAQTQYRDGSPTANADHSRNPRRHPFLSGQLASNINEPGIGPDGVYRDPWGNAYIITFDLNFDGFCADAMYRRENVSQSMGDRGLNTLLRPNGQTGDNFLYSGGVMVWSLGPDGVADLSVAADMNDPNTKTGNRDNVLSWGD